MPLFILHSYNFLLLSCNDIRFVETALRHDSSLILKATGGLFVRMKPWWFVVRVCVCVTRHEC
jgi:hypothetical protein